MTKQIQKIYTKYIISFMFILGLFFAQSVSAATLNLVPPKEILHSGQNFSVDILLDTQGENINTISADIVFPDTLLFVSSNDSNSIIGEWVDLPILNSDKHAIHFSGIIPNGFYGFIDPFNPTIKKPGKILSLTFTPTVIGDVTISTINTRAYLNDGSGTQTTFSGNPINLSIIKGFGQSLTSYLDTEPPFPFVPTLVHDPLLYNGKYVVVFSTKDKDSGVDHYEVKEGDSNWVVASSPYLLKDQKLSGTILVKAVDHLNNEIIETAYTKSISYFSLLKIFEILVAIALIILCAIILKRWFSQQHKLKK